MGTPTIEEEDEEGVRHVISEKATCGIPNVRNGQNMAANDNTRSWDVVLIDGNKSRQVVRSDFGAISGGEAWKGKFDHGNCLNRVMCGPDGKRSRPHDIP